jgi:hypothetical protein
MTQKKVGFFFELAPDEQRAQLMSLRRSTSHPNETEIVSYLRSGSLVSVTMMLEQDFVQNPPTPIGSAMIYSDGEWSWPASLPYYVAKYHIELPKEFVDRMKYRNWAIPHDADIARKIPEEHMEM